MEYLFEIEYQKSSTCFPIDVWVLYGTFWAGKLLASLEIPFLNFALISKNKFNF